MGKYACECACVHMHVSSIHIALPCDRMRTSAGSLAFKWLLFYIPRFMCNSSAKVKSTTTFFIIKYVKHTSTQAPMCSFEITEMQDLSQHNKYTVAVKTKTDPDFVYTGAHEYRGGELLISYLA